MANSMNDLKGKIIKHKARPCAEIVYWLYQ